MLTLNSKNCNSKMCNKNINAKGLIQMCPITNTQPSFKLYIRLDTIELYTIQGKVFHSIHLSRQK